VAIFSDFGPSEIRVSFVYIDSAQKTRFMQKTDVIYLKRGSDERLAQRMHNSTGGRRTVIAQSKFVEVINYSRGSHFPV